jgi:flagellar basal-body rod modification protein FlgD
MNIDKINPGALPAPATQKKEQLGQEEFLKILVAQMNNQDPTNPADNTQFLSQMAQFSMVSGINSLGTSMDDMLRSAQVSKSMQASSLVDREVLVETDVVKFSAGRMIEGQIPAFPGATDVNVQVRDMFGNLIKTIPTTDIGNQRIGFTWDGISERGELVSPDKYVITARALVGARQFDMPVFNFVKVEGVKINPVTNAVDLKLENGATTNLSQISQYR